MPSTRFLQASTFGLTMLLLAACGPAFEATSDKGGGGSGGDPTNGNSSEAGAGGGGSDTGGGSGTSCADACPTAVPLVDESCDCPERVCDYSDCAASNARYRATCSGAKWVLQTDSCSAGMNCYNTLQCEAGQLCQKINGGAAFACVDNPCWFHPVDCSCAAAACPASSPTCNYANDNTGNPDSFHMSCSL